MGLTWGPPGSCRPQMGPMCAPWTLLSGVFNWTILTEKYMFFSSWIAKRGYVLSLGTLREWRNWALYQHIGGWTIFYDGSNFVDDVLKCNLCILNVFKACYCGLKINHHVSGNGLAPNMRQDTVLINYDSNHWLIRVAKQQCVYLSQWDNGLNFMWAKPFFCLTFWSSAYLAWVIVLFHIYFPPSGEQPHNIH